MFDRIRRNIAAALGGNAAPAARKAPPAPVVPLGTKAPRTLNARDFAPGRQVIGARSVIARHNVPRGDVYELKVGAPMRLYLRGMYAATEAATAGGELTLDLGADGLQMIRSTRDAPAGPWTLEHPDLTVYTRETGSGDPFVARQVIDVDFDAGTVSVDGVAVSVNHDAEVFYLPGDGELALRAVQPSGIDQRSVELYNATLAGLHETDQSNGRTAPYVARPGLTGLPLGPKWSLALEVNAPVPVPFDDPRAAHELIIRGYRAPVSTMNERQLGAIIGGTLLNR